MPNITKRPTYAVKAKPARTRIIAAAPAGAPIDTRKKLVSAPAQAQRLPARTRRVNGVGPKPRRVTK